MNKITVLFICLCNCLSFTTQSTTTPNICKECPCGHHPTYYDGDKCADPVLPAGTPSWKGNAMKSIRQHEGTRRYIYLDCVKQSDSTYKKVPTVGVGHKVTSNDRFKDKSLGAVYSCKDIMDTFREDFDNVAKDVPDILKDFESQPDQVKEVLAEMRFQLGLQGLKNFKNMLGAINKKNYGTAAKEMQYNCRNNASPPNCPETLWYKQSGNRSKNLTKKMKAAAQK